MQVLAERYKTRGKILLIWGILAIALGIITVVAFGENKGWELFMLVLLFVVGVVCVGIGSYETFSPKQAILRDGDKLVFCFLFHTKTYSISELKYVNYPELGVWYNRRGSLWLAKSILENDVRRITITMERENREIQFSVQAVLYASAVAVTLQSLKDKE